MMTKRSKTAQPKPTNAELAILRVIWSAGPSTVRQVFEILKQEREMGYTTVLKLMQIMTEKGLLDRDATVRPQIFRPTQPQKHTQRQLMGDLIERVFNGSPGDLVLQALAQKKATTTELQQIRDLLDELEDQQS